MTITSLSSDSQQQELRISYQLKKLPQEYQKIISLKPEFIIGHTGLFYYDDSSCTVNATSSFCELLTVLAEKGILNPAISSVRSIDELNQILQQQQGPKGGLLRKNKTERWELTDEALKQEDHDLISALLKNLGFTTPTSLESLPTVDFCVVFGARVERMFFRLEETVKEIEGGLTITSHIFLLGSNRQLIGEELKWIHKIILKFDREKQEFWTKVFDDPNLATEANAFFFLWETQVPDQIQDEYKGRIIAINSTTIGSSYDKKRGYRATTEVTIVDMLRYIDNRDRQSIFAVTELPYIRLTDQLRFKILTHTKSKKLENVVKKIQNISFSFIHPQPDDDPLKTVIFDEIARNVYHTLNAVKYVNALVSNPIPPKL